MQAQFDGSKKRSCSIRSPRCLRFLQELGYTRMIRKSDGEPSISALVTAVQKEWAGDSKNFQTKLIPRRSPVDDHASNGAAEAMVHSLEGLTRTSKASGSHDRVNLSDSPMVGATSEFFSETGLLCDRVAEHLLKS